MEISRSMEGMKRVVAEKKIGEKVHKISDMSEVSLKSTNELINRKIIYPGMRQYEVLGAFRDLRTRLLSQNIGSNFTLMVSSLSESSGSSFVSVNTAASLAIDETKTAVYVDCNPDESYASKLLSGGADYGLMDYLTTGSLGIQDIIYSSGIPRLRVIPVGGRNDSSVEKLASPKMAVFMHEIKAKYPDRFIIFDVPPVSRSSIARILAPMMDLAVLVVPFGKVTTDQVVSGVDAVGKDRFAGLVFNNE